MGLLLLSACIVAHALRSNSPILGKAAEHYAAHGHHAPNPFLFDFYRSAGDEIPAEHIGLLYESVLAKAEPSDISHLSVDSDPEDEFVSVEISVVRSNNNDLRAEFRAPKDGLLRLGRKIVGVDVDAETMNVELGATGQLELISPIAISARLLMLNCDEVVVKSDSRANEAESLVILEAQQVKADATLPPPVVRQEARLQVAWNDSMAYPWTSFSFAVESKEDPATVDALRALRRLVMSFRSHSKGRLARYKGKIEHSRMTKGQVGQAMLAKLLQDEILSLEGPMYFLDPDLLGSKVGLSFLEVKLKRYSQQARNYVQSLGGNQ